MIDGKPRDREIDRADGSKPATPLYRRDAKVAKVVKVVKVVKAIP